MISPDEMKRSAPGDLIPRLIRELGGDVVLSEPHQLLPYETDAMPLYRQSPLCVLVPTDIEMVQRAIKILHECYTPWVARGAGSGLSGGALAADSGVVISLTRLKRFIAVDQEARRATVEPGLVNQRLNQTVATLGLQFAADPSSHTVSTIGGNIAENAGGPRTLKYGPTVMHVTGCRMVLSDGAVLTLGGAEETMGGYDILGFLHGSEGTLGLISEATVRLTHLPEATATFLAVFESPPAAGAGVTALLQRGVVPSALEMIDDVVLDALEAAFDISFPAPAGAILIGEVDGLTEEVAAELELVEESFTASGATLVRLARDDSERDRLWLARKHAFGALGRIVPNYISHDAVIPRSRLSEVLSGIAGIAERSNLRIANIFHAGDGNLHPAILFDASDPKQVECARKAGDDLIRLCLDADGVLTGEHGIGLSKRHVMAWAFTDEEIHLMDRLTTVFDPWRLTNPHKLLPEIADEKVAPVDSSRKRPPRDLSAPEASILSAIQDAYQSRDPVIPTGGGTLRIMPLCGRPSLTTTGLSKIIQYHPADFVVEVESGVTLEALSATLASENQELAWEAPDPARATMGGIISAGYWASKALQYGHPKYSLLGFRGITGGGELVQFGSPVLKNVSGYDVVKLIVGAAGTLAVTTRLTLRTYPIAPESELVEMSGDTKALFSMSAELAARPMRWARLDISFSAQRTVLHIGLTGHREGITRQLAEIEQARSKVLRCFSSQPVDIEFSRIRDRELAPVYRKMANWLCWADSVLILRLVVSPDKTIALAESLLPLLQCDNAIEKCRLQIFPGIGLIRVAFDPGFDDAVLRRIVLTIAEAVRPFGGYRALDRAPGNPWWGWNGWGATRILSDRMKRIQMVFDPRGILPAETPEETTGS